MVAVGFLLVTEEFVLEAYVHFLAVKTCFCASAFSLVILNPSDFLCTECPDLVCFSAGSPHTISATFLEREILLSSTERLTPGSEMGELEVPAGAQIGAVPTSAGLTRLHPWTSTNQQGCWFTSTWPLRECRWAIRSSSGCVYGCFFSSRQCKQFLFFFLEAVFVRAETKPKLCSELILLAAQLNWSVRPGKEVTANLFQLRPRNHPPTAAAARTGRPSAHPTFLCGGLCCQHLYIKQLTFLWGVHPTKWSSQ